MNNQSRGKYMLSSSKHIMALGKHKGCQVTKKRVTAGIFVFFVLSYLGASFVDYAHYTGNRVWASQPKCFNSKDRTARLVRLAHRTHSILDSMGIEHWLMYGSLWGPLRGIPGPLPWDHDIDFGIDGDGNFSKIPLEEFKARFTTAGLKINDTLQATSTFTLETVESSALGLKENVGLVVFYNHRGTMMRAGYEPWLFFINYRLYHSFPARLLQQPLPKVRFGSFNISVPRGGMEIMKHLYPFNWWKVVKPVTCKTRP